MEGTCEGCGLPMTADDAFCGSCGRPNPARATAAGGVTAGGYGAGATPPGGYEAGATPLGGFGAGATSPGGFGAGASPPGGTTTPGAAAGWSGAGETRPGISPGMIEPGWAGRTTLGPAVNGQPGDGAGLGWAPGTLYLGRRLAYSTEPENLDPLGNWRLLLQFFLRATLFSWLYWVGAVISGIVVAILFFAANLTALLLLWYVVGGLLFLGLVILWLLLPVPIQVAEWKFFAEGRAPAGPAVLNHMGWAFAQREAPVDMIQIRRLRLHSRQERDYLEVRQRQFSGFIGCFGYGRDLYLGWTFWWRVSPGRYLLIFLSRTWQSITTRGTDLYVALGYDYARALRETMHAVAMEGARVAMGDLRPEGQEASEQRLQVAVTDVER
jgi:hypothetical protein